MRPNWRWYLDDAYRGQGEGCDNARRKRLQRLHTGKGYKLCKCGTPIEPVIYIDPSTGGTRKFRGGKQTKIQEGGKVSKIDRFIGYPVALRMMCEVCWQENRGLVGNTIEGHEEHETYWRDY